MSAHVSPFTEEMKKFGFDGLSFDLFTGNLFDEEHNDAPIEEEDPEGDALCAAVFALIAEEAMAEEEKTIGDFCVPEGFVPLNISYKNVFYNKYQQERRAVKKVYKTAKKKFKKSSKSKVSKPVAKDVDV